ncbi:CLUMA_CG019694, isoform A [Clunio marinus]|uniref:CLUMA_CG019694, isoform A n=1 Tax=Clunio marinus TaxID=568069 RepID=A0A1J1J3B0_9DIPT|nr:CLUMA_CG019694, isoform A [Clunio marinus]
MKRKLHFSFTKQERLYSYQAIKGDSFCARLFMNDATMCFIASLPQRACSRNEENQKVCINSIIQINHEVDKKRSKQNEANETSKALLKIQFLRGNLNIKIENK